MPQAGQELSELIHCEIDATGPMACARFMQLALYHPFHGYYQQPAKQIGCQGDFFTSVSVGSLFGELLAFQFADWLERLLPATGRLHLVEAGAHDGRLALDVLSGLQRQRPDLLARLDYLLLEPSALRRAVQAATLQPFASHCRWFPQWSQLPPVRGVILSNELLDAFPAFRIGWDASRLRWFEWRIGSAAGALVWVRAAAPKSPEVERELAGPFWQELPSELLALLPDGFTVEICPAAREWWAQAAARLQDGKLLTLDYGLEAHEFLAPHRRNGTLRSYRKHRSTADPLRNPGTQDLTTHVNFSALREAGAQAGLQTDVFQSQADFLTRIVARAASDPWFGPWMPSFSNQFRTLTHPDHLGRSFRVLVQSRPQRG